MWWQLGEGEVMTTYRKGKGQVEHTVGETGVVWCVGETGVVWYDCAVRVRCGVA